MPKSAAEIAALKTRLKSQVAAVQPSHSMVPEPPPPPPAKEEVIPELGTIIQNTVVLTKMKNLVLMHRNATLQESAAKKAKKTLTPQIKTILGQYEIAKCNFEGLRINYYNAPRTQLDEKILLALGVSPIIIAKAKVQVDSFTLRIGEVGKEDEDA